MSASIRGAEQARDNLADVAARAADLRPAWPRVSEYVGTVLHEQFATEGLRLGKRWAPLNPEYRAWKVRSGLSYRRLMATGQMRRTLTRMPLPIDERDRQSGRFGSRHELAGFHQHGTANMPARPILYVGLEVVEDVRGFLLDWIVKGEVR